jgi:hypothetical protein
VKIYVAAEEVLKKKAKTGWNSVYHQKIGEKKLVWILVISFCKVFISSYVFDGLLCWKLVNKLYR